MWSGGHSRSRADFFAGGSGGLADCPPSNGFNKGGGVIRLSFGQSVDNNNLRVMLLSNAVAPPPPSPKSSQGGYNPRAPESITIALGIHRKSIGIHRESVVDP